MRRLAGCLLSAILSLSAIAPAAAGGEEPGLEALLALSAAASRAPYDADYLELRRTLLIVVGRERPEDGPGLAERIDALARAYEAARRSGEPALAERRLIELLETGFAFAPLHRMAADFYAERSGDAGKAARHRWIAARLDAAMVGIGDGRSYETAFPVIGTGEEEEILRILGCAPGAERRTRPFNRHLIDIWTCTRVGGEEVDEIFMDRSYDYRRLLDR